MSSQSAFNSTDATVRRYSLDSSGGQHPKLDINDYTSGRESPREGYLAVANALEKGGLGVPGGEGTDRDISTPQSSPASGAFPHPQYGDGQPGVGDKWGGAGGMGLGLGLGLGIRSVLAGSRSAGGQIQWDKAAWALAVRTWRAMKRGNLPFLILFVSCLYIFFAALAGVGYVPPPSSSSGLASASAAEFNPGAPVFDAAADPRELQIKAMEEQRALEIEWSKKRRPQDGAWMHKQRDDRAVRRKPLRPKEIVGSEELEIKREDEDAVVATASQPGATVEAEVTTTQAAEGILVKKGDDKAVSGIERNGEESGEKEVTK